MGEETTRGCGRGGTECGLAARGLIGCRSIVRAMTRGSGRLNSMFEGWGPYPGPMVRRTDGALVCDRKGSTTPYALFHLQPRGVLFVTNGTAVYEGMIIGQHSRENDLIVNVIENKKLTNVRAAGKDDALSLTPPMKLSLERALSYIADDELVEITPENIRLRKRWLDPNTRKKMERQREVA